MDNVNTKIFELIDFADTLLEGEKSDIKKGLKHINDVWNELPIEKMEDSDRTLLASILIDICLNVKEFDFAQKWIDIYLYKESYKPTINFYLGQLEYHKENYQDAYKLFREAQELSNNRELQGYSEYLEFLNNPSDFGVKLQ